MENTSSQQALNQISLSLVFLGLIVGFLVGYGVLIGDDQGRVNLLWLLVLFAFLPVFGLILSLVLLLTGGRKGLVGWILELPILPRHLAAEVLRLGISGSRKSWLFYQTQLLALSFAAGGLVVYLLLLLGSDISFVWRSTVLQASDILPVLNALAAPWSFWPEAQPSLELLQQTQDFRLSNQPTEVPLLGQWWKYIFAAQCTYNLLPRTLMLVISRSRYIRISNSEPDLSVDKHESEVSGTTEDEEYTLAEIVYSLATPYLLLDWADSPGFCHQHLGKSLGDPSEIRMVEPLAPTAKREADPLDQSIVVLVKSWEPPLRELGDFLSLISGPQQKYILPMDWNDTGVRPTGEIHLNEWRRFCATLESWQLLQLDEPS